jgi:hypothetical protein
MKNVEDKVRYQIWNQADKKVYTQVYWQIRIKIFDQMKYETWSQIFNLKFKRLNYEKY